MADSERPEGCSQESLVVMRVSMESNMSLLSSTVFMTEDLNISHSGIFGRELRRMKERTLSSTEYFIPARRDSTVRSTEMCSETAEVPSHVLLKSCWKR